VALLAVKLGWGYSKGAQKDDDDDDGYLERGKAVNCGAA
jgi:hypothetical protein